MLCGLVNVNAALDMRIAECYLAGVLSSGLLRDALPLFPPLAHVREDRDDSADRSGGSPDGGPRRCRPSRAVFFRLESALACIWWSRRWRAQVRRSDFVPWRRGDWFCAGRGRSDEQREPE